MFHIASEDEIKSGKTTDIYFDRTEKILESNGLSGREVTVEVTARSLPEEWPWAVLSGLDEVAKLFEDVPVDVESFPEGTIFRPYDSSEVRVPLMKIKGSYRDFCSLETPMLGLLCHSSGVSTKSARVRKAAGDKNILAFGIRRMHPAIAPMLDRSAFIGGFDGVSSIAGAEEIGKNPAGTMPHALMILMGDQVKAWKSFDEVVSEDVPRIALVDTYSDEKEEVIRAVEALQDKLDSVRLDTPSSRRGNFPELIREVRWELDIRGWENVGIVASGGLDEYNIPELIEAGADSFGVGTSVTNAPVLNLALDIVEVEGEYAAKRGKLSGEKDVWRCKDCSERIVSLSSDDKPKCPDCGGETESMFEPLIEDGEIVRDFSGPDDIKERVVSQLEDFEMEESYSPLSD
mgnify:CR=1 FL=1